MKILLICSRCQNLELESTGYVFSGTAMAYSTEKYNFIRMKLFTAAKEVFKTHEVQFYMQKGVGLSGES
jgi:hypothetical protein